MKEPLFAWTGCLSTKHSEEPVGSELTSSTQRLQFLTTPVQLFASFIWCQDSGLPEVTAPRKPKETDSGYCRDNYQGSD